MLLLWWIDGPPGDRPRTAPLYAAPTWTRSPNSVRISWRPASSSRWRGTRFPKRARTHPPGAHKGLEKTRAGILERRRGPLVRHV